PYVVDTRPLSHVRAGVLLAVGARDQAMSDLAHLLHVAQQAMDLARHMFTSRDPGALTQKTDRDYASDLDYAIEREVRDYLRTITPEFGFLGEEEGGFAVDPGRSFWAMDPVDGTANLLH